MSFLGHADESEVPLGAANTPAGGAGLHWPQGNAFAGIPIVNAGPWGRDYHTVLERLHTPYAFKVLPDLIGEIVTGVQRSGGRRPLSHSRLAEPNQSQLGSHR